MSKRKQGQKRYLNPGVFGPYQHHRKWRVHHVDVDGVKHVETFTSREEAATTADAMRSSSHIEATLATIARSLLATAIAHAPGQSRVYFLHDEGGEVIYVGIASNVDARIASHRERGVSFHRVSVLPSVYERSVARRLEAALIQGLRPALNIIHGGNAIGPMYSRGNSAEDSAE